MRRPPDPLIPKKNRIRRYGRNHAQPVNRDVANSGELDVGMIRTQRLSTAVFELLQRLQRGFHEASLFLIAFEQADQITRLGQSRTQRALKCFGLL